MTNDFITWELEVKGWTVITDETPRDEPGGLWRGIMNALIIEAVCVCAVLIWVVW